MDVDVVGPLHARRAPSYGILRIGSKHAVDASAYPFPSTDRDFYSSACVTTSNIYMLIWFLSNTTTAVTHHTFPVKAFSAAPKAGSESKLPSVPAMKLQPYFCVISAANTVYAYSSNMPLRPPAAFALLPSSLLIHKERERRRLRKRSRPGLEEFLR
ncbi:hypothetical protein BDZ97DRAFT_1753339 [Flammula alnicola]|nr:hypothetical protein BDZ97DRAFT_1753339 [Flammula alnicola]